MSRMSNRFLSALLGGFVMGAWVVVPSIFSPTRFAWAVKDDDANGTLVKALAAGLNP
jgi:hypothetical protein